MLSMALTYATFHHAGQLRKWSKVPYIVHPIRVYMLSKSYIPNNLDAQIAAILHDLLEDTAATYTSIKDLFGVVVADYVQAMSDRKEGNRAQRKYALNKAVFEAGPDIAIIKTFDAIDNLPSICVNADIAFGHVYYGEKMNMYHVLKRLLPAAVADDFLDMMILSDRILRAREQCL